jgi:hypothetical protein
MYRYELEAELSGVSESAPPSLDDKWKRIEIAVREGATKKEIKSTRRTTLVEREPSKDEREFNSPCVLNVV